MKKNRCIWFFIIIGQMTLAQKMECQEIEFYKKAIAYTLDDVKDSLVINVNNIPSLTFIGDWKKQGFINSKEKRKIELAFEKKSDSSVCNEIKTFILELNPSQRVSKENYYLKYLFSKPVVISKTRAVVFRESILKNKIYPSGGKAIGCNMGIFFSNSSGIWQVDKKICLEMY